MRSRILRYGIMVSLLVIPSLQASGDDSLESGPYPQRQSSDAALIAHDAKVSTLKAGSRADASVVKKLDVLGRGVRRIPGATTDVWALDGYAYIGTFGYPCGDGTGDNGSGVRIFDVRNPEIEVEEVGVIPSPPGSRSNDVKVARMNSGAILVHSNERCGANGVGGFEIWNVDDPLNPVFQAHVRIEEMSAITRLLTGSYELGVHNLFLFSQGTRDYVAAQAEGFFDGFRIYDITDPFNPVLMSGWGAEELFDPGVGDLDNPGDNAQYTRVFDAVLWLESGFGGFQNRYLHDFTISADGTRAYLAHWDAGLILLDVSDVTNPQVISVALDPSSQDGEVNSHAVWPSADGSVVIETAEDFDPVAGSLRITAGPNAGTYPMSEGTFTRPISSLPGAVLSGPTYYVGYACQGFPPVPPAPSADAIALVQRGSCDFYLKAEAVISAGYAGMVVFNDAARGDALVSMNGQPRDIPGVFVGHSTGLKIANVASAGALVLGAPGSPVEIATGFDNWGSVRLWDYADPANPVLAGVFGTPCALDPGNADCDPRGAYSVHNVILEDVTLDSGGIPEQRTRAYISWYADGVLVLDVTDPYNPVEVARYHREGRGFERQNGGIQNVWGIYKIPGHPHIYASDRNGGLYVLQEQTDAGDDAAPEAQAVAPGRVTDFALDQNLPNPFRGSTTIAFSLPTVGRVDLVIHDVAGRMVRTLAASEFAAGRHQVSWDGRDALGAPVRGGVYFYTLRTDGMTAQRKLVLLER